MASLFTYFYKEGKVLMKKVLVMGGSYFIGKKIAETLSTEFDVTVLNRGTRQPAPDVRTIICDRNDREAMKNSLDGKDFDFVVDVSGTNDEHCRILCESLDFSSMDAFVFISSSAVYDVEHLHAPFAENDALAENAFERFLSVRKNIAFKPDVTKNEEKIIALIGNK